MLTMLILKPHWTAFGVEVTAGLSKYNFILLMNNMIVSSTAAERYRSINAFFILHILDPIILLIQSNVAGMLP